MKLILQTLLITIIVLAVLGGAGYWFFQNLSGKEGDEISAAVEKIEQQEESEGTAEETEEPEPVGMTEGQVQIYLHQMTHQKIVADEKRGAVEMSAENIGNMLTIVKTNYDVYEHSAFYDETLMAWKNGDFSNAVSVHNTIWDWHNGTVERATGLMTPEQEAEYVSKHFK